MENNYDLIYGRDKTQSIVGLEITDGQAEVFIQQEDGSVINEIRPHQYWITSRNPITPKSILLAGNQFYRYISKTKDSELFAKTRREYKNRDIFSIYNSKESHMVLNGLTYYKGLRHNQIATLSFDIESTGLYHNDDSKILLISNTFRDTNGNIIRRLFAYDDYKSQKEMLLDWVEFVKEINPSIICGHNCVIFDLKYLNFIAGREGITLNLGKNDSPLLFNKYTSDYRIDGSRSLEYNSAKIYGREIIDTMFLSYRYGVTKNYNSYGLKYLIKEEGLEKENREFYDAGQIRFQYKNKTEWEKIKKYAEHDADDSLALFDLMVPAVFYTAQYIPKSFQMITESASGSQINSLMIRSYLQKGYSLPKASEIRNFKGGISFGIPGIYRNCWKIDIRSSYPSAILINKLYSKEKDPDANMYNLCKYFTLQRFEYKKKVKETNDNYYKGLDAAAKIFVNSIFGFCSAKGLLFNDPDVAAKITEYGRKYLNDGSLWATGKNLTEWIPNEELEKLENEHT